MRLGNTAPFKEILQQWQAIDNTVSDLTGPRFKPQTSHSRDENLISRPTNRYKVFIRYCYVIHQCENFVIGTY